MTRRPPVWLWPVLAFLVLGAAAALIVPSDYGANPRPTPPDEGPHLGYIIYLGQHARLPVFRSPNDNYEAHQPPLYYLSAVPLYLLANAFHAFPEGISTRPGIVVLRLWSVLLGALTVYLGWLLGRALFGPATAPALGLAWFLALWPGRLMIVSAVTNDGLAEALCLGVLVLTVRLLGEPFSPRRLLALGVACAAALLTKSTALALAPVVLLALVMRFGSRAALERDPNSSRQFLAAAALVGGAVLLLAGWWFVRNQLLYGDPLAAKVFQELFSRDRATPAYFLSRGMSGTAYYLLVTVHTALSFWGVYGQANVYNPAWYYVLGFALWLTALVGLVRREPRPRPGVATPEGRDRKATTPPAAEDWTTIARRQGWILCGVLLALVVAFFLRFNAVFYQAQARYLFTASGAIAALLCLGLWRLGKPVLWGGLGIVATMALWTLGAFPALAAAPTLPPFLGG